MKCLEGERTWFCGVALGAVVGFWSRPHAWRVTGGANALFESYTVHKVNLLARHLHHDRLLRENT